MNTLNIELGPKKDKIDFFTSTLAQNMDFTIKLGCDLDINVFNKGYTGVFHYPSSDCYTIESSKRDTSGNISQTIGVNSAEVIRSYMEAYQFFGTFLLGPFLVQSDSTHSHELIFSKIIRNSVDSAIGVTFINVDAVTLYNSITKICEKLAFDIYVFRPNIDTFIYHPDTEVVGTTLSNTRIYADTIQHLFTVYNECTFETENLLTNNNNLIFVNPILVPDSDIKLNIVVASDATLFTQSLSDVLNILIISLTLLFIILSMVIVWSAIRIEKLFFNTKIIYKSQEESYIE
jgi:hypothetical protein